MNTSDMQPPLDETATVCAIETFAEHWSEAQAFSVATLAACAITALETAQIDTLPWKHTFLRSLFRQLGIHSREEQEMLMALQENGSYQDCNLHVLAEPLLPARFRQRRVRHSQSSHTSSTSTPISSPPASPMRTRRSLQQPRQYGPNVGSPPFSPTHSLASSSLPDHHSHNHQQQLSVDEDVEELDIRTEVINDLLYIGLGFEPSTRSRKVPIQALSHELAGLDLDIPPVYSEKDSMYSISATDGDHSGTSPAPPNTKEHRVLEPAAEIGPPQLPSRTPSSLGPPVLPPRTPSELSQDSATSVSTNSKSTSSQASRGRVQPLEYDARARAVIFTMCNYLLLSFDSFLVVEKQIAQHLYFYQQELIEAQREELEQERKLKEKQRLEEHQHRASGGAGPAAAAGAKVGAFFKSLGGSRNNDQAQTGPLTQHGVAMHNQAQSSMQDLERKKKTWKYVATGLSIAAGATVIGLTGGLAAPLVAVGAGVLLGSGAAVLGTTAGIAVMASLFGLAGGGLAGYKMHRRTKGELTIFNC